MHRLQRLLLFIIAGELLVCGFYALQRLSQHQPVLPVMAFDDPFLKADFAALAESARRGDSSDWQLFGEGLLGQGFYGEAELAFLRALELDPRNGTAQFGLAFCVDRTGRVEESTREYLRAAEMTQSLPAPIGSREHCLYQVGRNSLRREQLQPAEKIFQGILAFTPAAYQHSKLLIRSGRSAEALPEIDKVLEKSPRSLKFNSLRLRALEDLGRQSEIADSAGQLERSQYEFPIDLSSNFVEPLSQRLGINREVEACKQLLASGDMDAVARKLNELLVLLEPTTHPQKYLLRKSLIEVEFQRQDADQMLASIAQLQEAGVSDADLLQMEGAAYSLRGDKQRAVELWLRAVQRSPNVPLHQILARHYDDLGDTPSRDQHLGQAALLMTKIYDWSNQLEAAQRSVSEAQTLLPENDQVWFYSAEIKQALGHPAEAQADYRRCVELNPGHGRAIRALE